ncbi:peptidase M12 [Pseudomonas azerbaijanoccidens]|uniref:peptidase M12 n=1 Tax=Pseudomonas azerbaijanoccidentalis TaxID=2842347 RepID=UPI00200B35F4|nr:peptidase M12 [Pseudomonas azerbaijanoccidentalis]MCK8668321.1 peptidase M12 [Pseudomonas azerbaijanoccidentalis]
MKNGICTIARSTDPFASYEAAINERSDNVKKSTSARTRRSVAVHTTFWEPGRTLKIAMYDEDQKAIDRVKSIAGQWLEHANLRFEFVSGAMGDIRIKIAPNESGISISQLGTDALAHPPEEPTMTIGVSLEDIDFEFHVLHEFGHVLGLDHEHQHPDADIPWDLDKVYAWYKEFYNVERERVDSDVLPLPRYPDFSYGEYDPLSIMHYNIDSRVTLNNWSHPGNFILSEGDKAAARKHYPYNTTYLPDILLDLFNTLKSPFTGRSR